MLKLDYCNPPSELGRLPDCVFTALSMASTEVNTTVLLSKYVISKHIKQKHEEHFKDWESFKKHVELMPEILARPDYVGFHPDRASIRLVKKIDEITVLALKIVDGGKGFEVKTLFPITESKLLLWLASGEMHPIAIDNSTKED